jgi:prevent-host-death family protein
MKTITVTIAEGKRDFSRLIKEAAEKSEDIVVTKRGKPMAVIIPYDVYRHSRKVEAHQKILESRAAFAKAGVSAAEVYRASREALEKKG